LGGKGIALGTGELLTGQNPGKKKAKLLKDFDKTSLVEYLKFFVKGGARGKPER